MWAQCLATVDCLPASKTSNSAIQIAPAKPLHRRASEGFQACPLGLRLLPSSHRLGGELATRPWAFFARPLVTSRSRWLQLAPCWLYRASASPGLALLRANRPVFWHFVVVTRVAVELSSGRSIRVDDIVAARRNASLLLAHPCPAFADDRLRPGFHAPLFHTFSPPTALVLGIAIELATSWRRARRRVMDHGATRPTKTHHLLARPRPTSAHDRPPSLVILHTAISSPARSQIRP